MENVLDEYSAFGVAVFLPNCAFTVELPRNSILPSLLTMENELKKRSIGRTKKDRLEQVVNNTYALSKEFNNEIKNKDTNIINEIVFSLLYVFVNKQHITKDPTFRGIICYVENQMLNFDAYNDNDTYEKNVEYFNSQLTTPYTDITSEYDDAYQEISRTIN